MWCNAYVLWYLNSVPCAWAIYKRWDRVTINSNSVVTGLVATGSGLLAKQNLGAFTCRWVIGLSSIVCGEEGQWVASDRQETTPSSVHQVWYQSRRSIFLRLCFEALLLQQESILTTCCINSSPPLPSVYKNIRVTKISNVKYFVQWSRLVLMDWMWRHFPPIHCTVCKYQLLPVTDRSILLLSLPLAIRSALFNGAVWRLEYEPFSDLSEYNTSTPCILSLGCPHVCKRHQAFLKTGEQASVQLSYGCVEQRRTRAKHNVLVKF